MNDAALTIAAIHRDMRSAESVIGRAASDHLKAFKLQMREKVGVEEIKLDEPHLPLTIAYYTLRYLLALEKLEKRLLSKKSDELEVETGGDEGEEEAGSEIEYELDAIENAQAMAAKQGLDGQRQPAFGINQYLWVGGECPLCAPNDGQIFNWGVGDEPGSIHPNCGCSAQPVIDPKNPYPDAIRPVYPIETLIGLFASRGMAGLLARAAIGRATSDEAAPQSPKDILMPGGNPYGRAGNRQEVRLQNGGDKAARDLYDLLSEGGVSDTPETYSGEGTRLQDGGWVGYRPDSRSGPPTVDVSIEGIDFNRIHFLD